MAIRSLRQGWAEDDIAANTILNPTIAAIEDLPFCLYRGGADEGATIRA